MPTCTTTVATFRLRTAEWQCRPSTRSGFLLVAKWGTSGGGALRARSAGLSRWAPGTQVHSPLASDCMTSEHTPPSFSWHSKTEKNKQSWLTYNILLCTGALWKQDVGLKGTGYYLPVRQVSCTRQITAFLKCSCLSSVCYSEMSKFAQMWPKVRSHSK